MRAVRTVLLTLVLGYLGLLVVVFLFQDRLVFFPNVGGRRLAWTPAETGLDFEAVTLATADGERLAAWFVPAGGGGGDPARPADRAVLLCHGNAGSIAHRLDYLPMLRGMGFATLLFDYRGYGESTGRPGEEGLRRDARAAWAFLSRERGFAPARIALLGESLGGAVAARLAADLEAEGAGGPGALVLQSAFTSVPDLGAAVYPFLPVRLLARLRFDTRAAVARLRGPLLVAHSRDDEIVPFAHAQRLVEAAAGHRELLEMRGGHNEAFFFARPEWAAALARFLDAQLPPEGAPSGAAAGPSGVR
jgi:fermentation-respiration switch protein FrsA (DUF1100 family)